MSEYGRSSRRPVTRGIDGKISRVVVAEWPEEDVELARVGVDQSRRNPTFEVCAEGRYAQELYHCQRGSQAFSFRVPINGTGNPRLFLPHLRWAAAVLGISAPRQSPFLSMDSLPSANDPFVGAFQQRTMEELFRDARLFDLVLAEWMDLDTSEDGAHVASLLLPSTTTDSRFLDHYPSSYRDLPMFCDGSFSVEFVSCGRGNFPLVNISRPGSLSSSQHLINRRYSRSLHELFAKWLQDEVLGLPRQSSASERLRPWFLLSADDADRWWTENTRPGRLCLSEEEVEVFQVLGEDLPFCWSNERLGAWADERWPAPEP